MKYHLVVITHNRAKLITTPQFFMKDFGDIVNVIVNPPEQLPDYQANESLEGIKLITCPVTGIIPVRNWVLDNIGEEGDWLILMDDNILGFQETQDEKDVDVSAYHFLSKVLKDLELCDKNNIWLYGTATNSNLFFRKKNYKTIAHIQHKFCAIKKSAYRYDKNLNIREEFDVTAYNLLKYGKVLRNDWLYVKRKHYMEGGIGTREQRDPLHIQDTNYLMSKYPNLFRIKKKDKTLYGSEINLRVNTPAALKKWRSSLR